MPEEQLSGVEPEPEPEPMTHLIGGLYNPKTEPVPSLPQHKSVIGVAAWRLMYAALRQQGAHIPQDEPLDLSDEEGNHLVVFVPLNQEAV